MHRRAIQQASFHNVEHTGPISRAIESKTRSLIHYKSFELVKGKAKCIDIVNDVINLAPIHNLRNCSDWALPIPCKNLSIMSSRWATNTTDNIHEQSERRRRKDEKRRQKEERQAIGGTRDTESLFRTWTSCLVTPHIWRIGASVLCYAMLFLRN